MGLLEAAPELKTLALCTSANVEFTDNSMRAIVEKGNALESLSLEVPPPTPRCSW